MSNPPPIVTLAVPVLGWYSVQSGGIQTSQILSVPNASYLSSPDGLNNGLVGVADGALAHLSGLKTTMDGGQNLIMWNATSLLMPDGVTVFSPFPSVNTPGRWLAQIQTKIAVSTVVVTGTTIQISSATELVSVRKQIPSPTTILLPNMTIANPGQTVAIADTNGVASNFPITVTNSDGAFIGPISLRTNLDVINTNGALNSYTPDGTSWIKG